MLCAASQGRRVGCLHATSGARNGETQPHAAMPPPRPRLPHLWQRLCRRLGSLSLRVRATPNTGKWSVSSGPPIPVAPLSKHVPVSTAAHCRPVHQLPDSPLLPASLSGLWRRGGDVCKGGEYAVSEGGRHPRLCCPPPRCPPSHAPTTSLLLYRFRLLGSACWGARCGGLASASANTPALAGALVAGKMPGPALLLTLSMASVDFLLSVALSLSIAGSSGRSCGLLHASQWAARSLAPHVTTRNVSSPSPSPSRSAGCSPKGWRAVRCRVKMRRGNGLCLCAAGDMELTWIAPWAGSQMSQWRPCRDL